MLMTSATKLLEMMKDLSDEQKQIDEVFGENEYLYYKVDDLVDIMLDEMGIPDDSKGLCREKYYQLIYDYTLGYSDLSAEEVLDRIIDMRANKIDIEFESDRIAEIMNKVH